MKEMWDQRYNNEDLVYGKDPNLFFKSFVDTHPPGSLLLPAEGEGRNALYAASKGWEVFAVDFSDVARKKALKRAKEEGFEIQYEIADLATWKCSEKFDYVAIIYGHFPEKTRRKLHEKFASYLKSGGCLIMEAFSQDQLHYTSGGPRDISMLYSVDMLKKDFASLQIDYLEEIVKEVNESSLHSGIASIIRMTAYKKKKS